MAAPILVLVHSPLVGPFSWSLVADELRRRAVGAAVPALRDRGEKAGAFWWQHAMAAAAVVAALPHGRQIVLAGHSGAGSLLPAIRQLSERHVAGYLFVDAGIPEDGLSRLDLLRNELPEMAAQFEAHLRAGGRFPECSDADLAVAIPDAVLRERLLAEVQPRSLPFWEEPISVFPGWPDAPCAYLQFSDGYSVSAERARREGWAIERLDGSHFQMLVSPPEVVGAMLRLMGATGVQLAPERTSR